EVDAIGPDPLPTDVAGYEGRGEVGQGGMGLVYRAWDRVLRRDVALKMVKPTNVASTPTEGVRLNARFHQEAQVLAKLRHENIVPIFEAGVFEGRPYFVM